MRHKVKGKANDGASNLALTLLSEKKKKAQSHPYDANCGSLNNIWKYVLKRGKHTQVQGVTSGIVAV